MRKFSFQLVTDPILIDQIYRLRYRIYVEECSFVPASDCLQGKEIDIFDEFAMHICAINNNDQTIVAAVRLIVDSVHGFPLERRCDYPPLKGRLAFSRDKIAEVSRLVISPDYRIGEWICDPGAPSVAPAKKHFADFSSRLSPIIFGLYRESYKVSREKGITHWLAAMEEPLLRLSVAQGFIFSALGEPIDYYGKVIPCVADIEVINRNLGTLDLQGALT